MQFPARIIAVYMILLARIDGIHLLVKVDGQTDVRNNSWQA